MQEDREEAEPGNGEPAARNGGHHHGLGAIETPGVVQIPGEEAVLVLVPTVAGLLREPRAIADQALDEIVSHFEPPVRPGAALAVEVAAQCKAHEHPHAEQGGLAATGGGEDCRGERDFNQPHDSEKAAVEHQRLHRLGLEDPPQQPAHSLVADLFGLELEGAGEEPPLEKGAGADGEPRPAPGVHGPERHDAGENQAPGQDSVANEMTAEDSHPQRPPRSEEEGVAHEVKAQ